MSEKGLKFQRNNGSHFETINKLVIQPIWFFNTFYLKNLNTFVICVVLCQLIIIFYLFTKKKIDKIKKQWNWKSLIVIFWWKLSTFGKFVISPKLKNILKFGLHHRKCPKIYYQKELNFKNFGNFLTKNFASQNNQDEWNTLYILFQSRKPVILNLVYLELVETFVDLIPRRKKAGKKHGLFLFMFFC